MKIRVTNEHDNEQKDNNPENEVASLHAATAFARIWQFRHCLPDLQGQRARPRSPFAYSLRSGFGFA